MCQFQFRTFHIQELLLVLPHTVELLLRIGLKPEYGLGFWQCKLRYQTQEELLEVAREYKRRGIPVDVIVVDFFHWPKQGFSKSYTLYSGSASSSQKIFTPLS